MMMRVTRANTLTEQVMDHVRSAIFDGSMTADEWYSVYQLADQLGISRSPVRDALLRLEEAGLIMFVRNRGFQIRRTRPEDVAEIFALRLSIEPGAAGRAALLADTQAIANLQELLNSMEQAAHQGHSDHFFDLDQAFHAEILRAGNSPRGRDFIDRLRTNTRLIGASTAGSSRTLLDIHREHQPIFEAIADGDIAGARSAMSGHVTTTGQLLLKQAMPDAEAEDLQLLWEQFTA
ncbi:GntR family transcriptional regulator [Corynebacterium hindlerae]|uniref:GntR family transcriptional regulator n=1 Tax=Corynebacterium hindlerae TaxID=699041 RepID=UPI0031B6BBFB